MSIPIKRSLHLGVNRVDSGHYSGFGGQLDGAVSDAQFMAEMAIARGFQAEVLADAQATSTAVINHLDAAAHELPDGSFYFLTFAGHGGNLPNRNPLDPEPFDQTWALWDRQLLDDELNARWPSFGKVRILVFSDACHNGSILTNLFRHRRKLRVLERFEDDLRLAVRSSDLDPVKLAQGLDECLVQEIVAALRESPIVRSLPPAVNRQTYEKNKEFYDAISDAYPPPLPSTIGAKILSISACRDSETTEDGNPHGAFTQELIRIWNSGQFRGSHQELWRQLYDAIAPLGVRNPAHSFAGLFSMDFWNAPLLSL